MAFLPATVVPDGAWFPALAGAHLAEHAARGRRDRLSGESAAARAEREIRRVARRAALASGLAAAGVTGGALAAWLTEGLAAPVAIPAGLLAIVLDGAYTALLGIDLVCAIAAILGAPLAPGDGDAVAAVFAEALHLDPTPGDLGARVGRCLMARALARDVVPLANLGLGAVTSYRTMLALGAAAGHIGTRRAGPALKPL